MPRNPERSAISLSNPVFPLALGALKNTKKKHFIKAIEDRNRKGRRLDLGSYDIDVHILEHISYIIVGSIIGMSIMAMTPRIRMGLLYFAFMQAGMMGSMMLVWPSFYPAYSASQNLTMDTTMMLFGAVGLIGASSTLLKYLDIL